MYKNLSGGEKAAFDLLLDIYRQKENLTHDAVMCIDEPEVHMGSWVHRASLLQEVLYELVIPDKVTTCGWRTHSIGILRKASKRICTKQIPRESCISWILAGHGF